MKKLLIITIYYSSFITYNLKYGFRQKNYEHGEWSTIKKHLDILDSADFLEHLTDVLQLCRYDHRRQVCR